MKNAQLIKRIVCSVLIVIFAVVIVFTGTIMINKSFNKSYESCSKLDRDLFAAMDSAMSAAYLSSSYQDAKVNFNCPVIAVQKGAIRGNAYLFNMPITEHSGGIFNMNMGMYAQEILLTDTEYVPSPYRLALFTPGLGSLIFQGSSDTVKTVKLCGEDVIVIPYDETSVADGTFAKTFVDNALDVTVPELPAIGEDEDENNDAEETEGETADDEDEEKEVSTDEDEEFGDAETEEESDTED